MPKVSRGIYNRRIEPRTKSARGYLPEPRTPGLVEKYPPGDLPTNGLVKYPPADFLVRDAAAQKYPPIDIAGRENIPRLTSAEEISPS